MHRSRRRRPHRQPCPEAAWARRMVDRGVGRVGAKAQRDLQPAPGSRVRVRGEEWAVQKCLPLDFGGFAVHVQGVSELVRYHQAIFLTPLDDIDLLRPEETRLVSDPTPEYRQTRLYLETLLRRMPPMDD